MAESDFSYQKKAYEEPESDTPAAILRVKDEAEVEYAGMVGSMFFCSFWAVVLAMTWLYVMSRMPYTFLLISNGGQIALCLVAATLMLSRGYGIPGTAILLVGVGNGLWLFVARDRLAFASLLLEHCCRVVASYSGVIALAVGALVVQMVYICMWSKIVQVVYREHSGGWMIVLLVMFYWTTQVVQNVVHVAVSGVMGTWYFMHSHQTEDPTTPCLRRALTTSLGSVCLGSLGIAPVKTLEVIARSGPATHPVVGVLFVQAQELADQAMEHFNPYAFAHVAIYGKPYLYAAAETLQLIRQCGITTVINDSLINPLLLMVSIVGGFIIGSMVALATMHVPTFLCAWMVSSAVIGVIMSVLHSAVVAVFVCFAEEPDTLRLTNPDLHQRITHVMAGLGDDEEG